MASENYPYEGYCPHCGAPSLELGVTEIEVWKRMVVIEANGTVGWGDVYDEDEALAKKVGSLLLPKDEQYFCAQCGARFAEEDIKIVRVIPEPPPPKEGRAPAGKAYFLYELAPIGNKSVHRGTGEFHTVCSEECLEAFDCPPSHEPGGFFRAVLDSTCDLEPGHQCEHCHEPLVPERG